MTDIEGPVLQVRLEDLPPDGGPAPAAGRPGGRRIAVLAWTALGLGAVSILVGGFAVGPVAVITGIVAAMQAERREGHGRHVLVACGGILCGLVGSVLWTFLLLHWMEGSARRAAGIAPAPVTSGSLDRDAIEQAPEPIRRALFASASIRVLRRTGAEWTAGESGSGTFVSRAGGRWFVLTCAHVVAGAVHAPDGIRLKVQWVGGEMNEPRVEWTGPGWLDLALVSTGDSADGGQPTVAPISAQPGLGVGDGVFAVGDPHQYRVSYVSGVLSAVRLLTEGPAPVRIIQSQVPLNPGNSGGGLYNTAGELIGVNSWRLAGAATEGMGFSIAIDNLWAAMEGAPEAVARVVAAMRPGSMGAPAGAGDPGIPARP